MSLMLNKMPGIRGNHGKRLIRYMCTKNKIIFDPDDDMGFEYGKKDGNERNDDIKMDDMLQYYNVDSKGNDNIVGMDTDKNELAKWEEMINKETEVKEFIPTKDLSEPQTIHDLKNWNNKLKQHSMYAELQHKRKVESEQIRFVILYIVNEYGILMKFLYNIERLICIEKGILHRH